MRGPWTRRRSRPVPYRGQGPVVEFLVFLGRMVPGKSPGHGAPPHNAYMPASIVPGPDRPSRRVEDGAGSQTVEHETRAGPGLLIVVLHGVGQPPGPVDDRQGSVAEAVHLIEAAGLVAARHHEKVRAGLDEVGDPLVVADDRAEVGQPGRERADLVLAPAFARADEDELQIHLGADIVERSRTWARTVRRRPSGRPDATPCR